MTSRRPSFYNSVKTSRLSSDDTRLKNSPTSSRSSSSSGITLIPSACDAPAHIPKGHNDPKNAASPKMSEASLSHPEVEDGTHFNTATSRKGLKSSCRSLKHIETFDGEDPMITAVMECRAESVGSISRVRSLKHLETLNSEDLRVSSLMDAHATGADTIRKDRPGKSNSMRRLKTLDTLSGEDMLVASVMKAHKGCQILGAAPFSKQHDGQSGC